MTNFQHLIDTIYQLHLPTGQSLFQQISHSEINLNDESSIHQFIFTEAIPYSESDPLQEFLQESINTIHSFIPENTNPDFPNYNHYHKTDIQYDGITQFDSKCGDYIRIQTTDHHLYITYFQSGQY